MSSSIPYEVRKIAEDIRSMRIRGAGRIARAATRAMLVTVKGSDAKNVDTFLNELETVAGLLVKTRPTAVSLPNAVRFVLKRSADAKAAVRTVDELKEVAGKAAQQFIEESKQAVKRIGEIGGRRVDAGDTILTHCNSESSTAILTTAWSQGKDIRVFVTETRPKFQGRETARTLGLRGIPTTLIVDSAARYFMNKIDKVVVGADAVAVNGAVVNKIGTSAIALAAKEARSLFFVAAETYKFNPQTTLGELVKIEERSVNEVITQSQLKRLKNVTVRNPAFDITPPDYIDLIITEKGIIPPQAAISVIQQEFGWSVFETMKQPHIIEEE